MQIIAAPDSFKGSLSAGDICQAVKRGIAKVDDTVDVVSLPLADGGEGTKENMVLSTSGKLIETEVEDPLGRKIAASYGILGDEKTVVIEMASASGITLLTDEERDPRITSSRGTGDLIIDALNRGYRDFVVAIGGSATNDGGTGMLEALGMKFLDKDGNKLKGSGGSLKHIHSIDEHSLDPRLKEARFVIASDVTNPLCGERGASHVFGPQKGASYELAEALDQGMQNYAGVIKSQKNIDITDQPGAGAAGGMGAALLVFLEADMQSGIDVVMEKINFEEKIKGARMIITGEGSLDEQTLSGKVIAGVGKIARKQNVPVTALCGKLDLSYEDIQSLHVNSAFSIMREPCSLEKAFEETAYWVQELAAHIYRLSSI
ncbi:glycerate kinase [Alkalicoccus saliphilus]|uniref:Glycerate kinase n=1 Tax=Alkalicoccus saliphilus TaxID=200989 RepID=A0A2T4U4S9_9BACI|nr:glycerate kinase [Alkalicoccus saliphilus]PTL38410.1 glycerate kinase [Alkalicoccus saliphilus]